MGRQEQLRQRGFTMVELMIATLVFSVILLVVTAGIMRFSSQYYKGIISGQTQNTARFIIDDVARSVQYNNGQVYQLTTNDPAVPADPANLVVGYCIGESKRYSFARNKQVSGNTPLQPRQSHFALISDNTTGCSTSTEALDPTALSPPLPAGGNARELLGENMRLSKFSIEEIDTATYDIAVRVVYGDDDFLCSPSTPGTCDPSSSPGPWLDTAEDLTCKSIRGSHFCAVSELSTTVKKRVN